MAGPLFSSLQAEEQTQKEKKPATVKRETVDAKQKSSGKAKDGVPPIKNTSKVAELLEMSVATAGGETAGHIQDIVIDWQSGKVLYAVVASGGVLGLGEKLLAVPPQAVSGEMRDGKLVLRLNKKQIEDASGFQNEEWPRHADPQLKAKGPAVTQKESPPTGERQRDTAERETDAVTTRGQEGESNPDPEERTVDPQAEPADPLNAGLNLPTEDQRSVANEESPSKAETAGSKSHDTADGKQSAKTREHVATKTRDPQPREPVENGADEITKLNKGSHLLEMTVRNHANEELGTIQELVVDLNSGRLRYIVLASGGFLGIGEKLMAVPPAAFKVEKVGEIFEGEKLVLDIEKKRLKEAPGFDKHNWPSMANREWEKQVHEFYGQEFESAGQAAEDRLKVRGEPGADSTDAQSVQEGTPAAEPETEERDLVRERRDAIEQPEPQDSLRVKENIAQRLKEALEEASQDASFQPEKVHVLFVNGTATLQGKVDSRADKEKAEEVVREFPEVEAVQNRLEVVTQSR